LCFNLCGGARRLPAIAPKLVAKINGGDYAGAAMELLDIDRANGRVLPGLVRRREAERTMFLA
jgi:GH24 family phage-related lysozyme (muramidase)